jgi:uncharacterized protein (TIGR02444 family)
MDNNPQHTFWTWALKRYDDPGLRECLLALQESCGLVVVEALFFAWLAEQGRQLEFAEARRMEEVITPWVDKVLLPLRRQRVEWTNNKETESLRREALRLELEAEKTLAELFWETFEPPLGEARPVAYRLNLSLITSLSCSDDLDRLIAAFER